MAKNDYHVVVYQILSYLYQCLKNGIPVDEKCINNNNNYISINEKYWKYIIVNMMKQGLIEGILITHADNDVIISCLEDAQITPRGIEFLCDNSFMEKAKQFLKDIKEITPFI